MGFARSRYGKDGWSLDGQRGSIRMRKLAVGGTKLEAGEMRRNANLDRHPWRCLPLRRFLCKWGSFMIQGTSP